MFLGIDVHHAKLRQAETKKQTQSLAALVCTIVIGNKWRTYCKVIPMKARYEVLGQITELRNVPQPDQMPEGTRKVELLGPEVSDKDPISRFITEACKAHKCEPDTIIVYRDGVAHSQLSDVKKWEASQVHEAYPKADVIYAVIQKQNHVRFLVQSPDGQVANPPPGTVFDSDAKIYTTEPLLRDINDFYLIPTYNGTSTAKPIHYCIIDGANKIPMDQFQNLTFLTCHLYPNWASSIRVPFVTQAAHELAYLMGDLFPSEDPAINAKLSKSYFYL